MACGIALDIGTTTLSASLVDLETGRVNMRFSCLNGQISYGHDIISRLSHAVHKTNGLERLNRSIVSSINFVFEKLLKASAVKPDSIKSILAVGNSVMYHFLFSLPVESFTRLPYKPYRLEGMAMETRELGIKNLPKATLRMLPNIGGFIGSDTLAVILATRLYKSRACALAMDIGTNGEIMLGSSSGIYTAATAAGPAFEGWHVSSGMRAVRGAIESVEDKKGRIEFVVIGGAKPKGLAASGLIDLVGILLKRGQIDRSGRLKPKKFTVYEGAKEISLNQSDVREVQLAKAAIAAGVKLLRTKRARNISKAYITGTFGNRLNGVNARAIGLVPKDIAPDRIEFLRYGALRGAEMVLANPRLKNDIKDILKKTEHIALAEDKAFQKEFAAAMNF